MDKHFYVYILASRKHGTIYVGVTNDLIRRVYEHKENLVPGFSKDHDVHKLVYYEIYDDPESAITREKRLKKWKRDWKIELIERDNPNWDDLSGANIEDCGYGSRLSLATLARPG